MPPRLVYLVTEDWYFLSHRLPVARAARDAGWEVHVACRLGEGGPRIQAEGFHLHPLAWSRGRRGPLALARAVAAITALYRRLHPQLVHHVAMQPVVIGALAARLAGVPAVVNALTGLGHAFTGRGWRARLAGLALRGLLPALLDRPGSLALFQNRDDADQFVRLGLVGRQRVRLIRGSGIELERFAPQPPPAAPPVVVGYVGRLLRDKGVPELVAAHRRLTAGGLALVTRLAGTPDPANPSSLDPGLLESWRAEPGLVLEGHVTDIPGFWASCHIACLPSWREGLPKSLLEAAAAARPIVATDVPGCREVAVEGENALTVPARDDIALAGALGRLATDSALRARFGAAGRRLVESDLSAEAVATATLALYRELAPC